MRNSPNHLPAAARLFRFLIVPLVLVTGCILPIDFLHQVDAYRVYLTLPEVFIVFGWAWLAFAAIGIAVGLCAMFVALIAYAIRQDRGIDFVYSLLSWFLVSVLILSGLRISKLWLESFGLYGAAAYMSRHLVLLIIASLLVAGVSLYRYNLSVRSLVRGCSAFSLLGAVIALGGGLASMSLRRANVPASPTPTPVVVAGSRPNIVLITFDALAANHCSVYGYERDTTPNLRELGEQALVFDRFYANSNFTTPTIASVVSGVRPWAHRANQALARARPEFAGNGFLAGLKGAGYSTYAVATNILASPFHNQSAPFFEKIVSGRTRNTDTIVFSFLYQHGSERTLPLLNLGLIAKLCVLTDRLLVACGRWSEADHFDPELPFSSARAIVDQRRESAPMFLWVHLLVPHAPYATPSPYLGSFQPGSVATTRFNSSPPTQFWAGRKVGFPSDLVGRYDESILYADQELGKFLRFLKDKDLFHGSAIFISADHGESFSRGYGDHAGPMLHEDLIRIPLIVKLPGQQLGRRVQALGEQVDLGRTILQAASAEDSAFGGVGVSLLGPQTDVRTSVFSMNFEQNGRWTPLRNGTVAVIESNWKFVHRMGRIKYPEMPVLRDELYDLRADPGEKMNVIDIHPECAAEMKDRILARLKALEEGLGDRK